jgi:hypothetical protein
MSETIIVRGKVVGGHMMSHSLLPRLVDGSVIELHFDGSAAYPERITATTPDGQYAGHLNKQVADIIHKSRHRVVSMSAVCRETSSRRKEGWCVEVHYTISPE